MKGPKRLRRGGGSLDFAIGFWFLENLDILKRHKKPYYGFGHFLQEGLDGQVVS